MSDQPKQENKETLEDGRANRYSEYTPHVTPSQCHPLGVWHLPGCVCVGDDQPIVSRPPVIHRAVVSSFEREAFVKPRQISPIAAKIFRRYTLVPAFLKHCQEFKSQTTLLQAADVLAEYPYSSTRVQEVLARARAITRMMADDPSTYRFWRCTISPRVEDYHRSTRWCDSEEWPRGPPHDPRMFGWANKFINKGEILSHMELALASATSPIPLEYIPSAVVTLVSASFGPGVWSHHLPVPPAGLLRINGRASGYEEYMLRELRKSGLAIIDGDENHHHRYDWALECVRIGHAAIYGVIRDVSTLSFIELRCDSILTDDPIIDGKEIKRAQSWFANNQIDVVHLAPSGPAEDVAIEPEVFLPSSQDDGGDDSA